MSAPSEKHNIKDALSHFVRLIEDYRKSGDYHGEAEAWKLLSSFAIVMGKTASECHESLNRLKEVAERATNV